MRIICLTSSQPGHMDFGGQGFVRLAKSLQHKNHHVTWLSFGLQPERLKKQGCVVDEMPTLRGLSVIPFFTADKIDQYKQQHQSRINAIQILYSLLHKEKPDILIIDRLLTYASLVAKQLNIPFVAMGTPGGYWQLNKQEQCVHVSPSLTPVHDYADYGEILKKSLDWQQGENNSFWTHSPSLNVCFMNTAFYPLHNNQKKQLVSVNHHQKNSTETKDKRLGISFGNQGNQQHLLKLLEYAIDLPSDLLPINIFVGSNQTLYKQLDNLYNSKQITLHHWVDFNQCFSVLSALIFLGGIGTIWQCIEHNIPMLITSGNIGDQRFNAERVQAMGIGVHLSDDIKKDVLLATIIECCKNKYFKENISAFKQQQSYTDTLETACQRIESI